MLWAVLLPQAREAQSPSTRLHPALQRIQQQLRRIATLVGIGQWDSARIQLREGPTAGLRRTLRETADDFVSVSDSVSLAEHHSEGV